MMPTQTKTKFALNIDGGVLDTGGPSIDEIIDFVGRNMSEVGSFLIDQFTPIGALRVIEDEPAEAVARLVTEFIGTGIGGIATGFNPIGAFIGGGLANILRDSVLRVQDFLFVKNGGFKCNAELYNFFATPQRMI